MVARHGGVDVDVECVVPARSTAPASADVDAKLAAHAAAQRRAQGRAAVLEGRLDVLRGESSALLDALTVALDPRATAARGRRLRGRRSGESFCRSATKGAAHRFAQR